MRDPPSLDSSSPIDPSERTQAQLRDLSAVEQTLFIPLLARARDAGRRHPVLGDQKAAEIAQSVTIDKAKYARGWGGAIAVLRTAILDSWVRRFLVAHPAGTVVDIGSGLNTRFDRVDNGAVRWFDLDLPDVIALRRQFFGESERRRMIAGSVIDPAWLRQISRSRPPVFFVAEGVFVYIPEEDVRGLLTRIVERFTDARIAFDTYRRSMFEWQHRMAAKRELQARWAWACDDPRSFEGEGLRVVESATLGRLPPELRSSLPTRYRIFLRLAGAYLQRVFSLTLFASERSPLDAQGDQH